MGNTDFVFAFDDAAKAAIPGLAQMKLHIGKDLAIPSTGEFVSFKPLPGNWFVVGQRQFAYDGEGKLVITLLLSKAG